MRAGVSRAPAQLPGRVTHAPAHWNGRPFLGSSLRSPIQHSALEPQLMYGAIKPAHELGCSVWPGQHAAIAHILPRSSFTRAVGTLATAPVPHAATAFSHRCLSLTAEAR